MIRNTERHGSSPTAEHKRVFRWFGAWADEREEAWLTEMAREGWHLVAPNPFGSYEFRRGEPRNVVYRLDFKTADKDMDHYLQLFADAGWEHVGTMGGWQYFRKETPSGKSPEIYTDAASKVAKYGRVLLILVVMLPVFLTTVILVGTGESTFMQGAGLLGAGLMILYVYAVVRILLRVAELRR